MIDINAEGIEVLEPVKNYEELAENSSFDITVANGKITATKNLR